VSHAATHGVAIGWYEAAPLALPACAARLNSYENNEGRNSSLPSVPIPRGAKSFAVVERWFNFVSPAQKPLRGIHGQAVEAVVSPGNVPLRPGAVDEPPGLSIMT